MDTADLTGSNAARGDAAARIVRQPLHGQIVQRLRDEIVAGHWPPNQRLPEPLLCTRFGVSRTPLRDAFRTLEAEGLVCLLPFRGAVVTMPTVADIGGTMDVLRALEALAAELVCRSAPAEAITALHRMHQDMMAAFDRNDAASYYGINAELHRRLVQESGNVMLQHMHQVPLRHVERVRNLANASEHLNLASRTDHERLMQALLARDAAAAWAAMDRHLLHVGDKIKAALETYLKQKPAAAGR